MQKSSLDHKIAFTTAKDNFYLAAQYGLKANVTWIDKKVMSLQGLILEVLIPAAIAGLEASNINKAHIEHYINDIFKPRVQHNNTGSAWQKSFVAKHGTDFKSMLELYSQQQKLDLPIHTWKI